MMKNISDCCSLISIKGHSIRKKILPQIKYLKLVILDVFVQLLFVLLNTKCLVFFRVKYFPLSKILDVKRLIQIVANFIFEYLSALSNASQFIFDIFFSDCIECHLPNHNNGVVPDHIASWSGGTFDPVILNKAIFTCYSSILLFFLQTEILYFHHQDTITSI